MFDNDEELKNESCEDDSNELNTIENQNEQSIENNSEDNISNEKTEDQNDESINDESNDNTKKIKTTKYVKKSTMITAVIISVFIALIIGVQLCFAVISSIYEKKYQNYINEYIENIKNNNKSLPTESNKINDAIKNITSLFDKHYLYESNLYKDDVLDTLLKYYVELTGDKYARYYTKAEWEEETKSSAGNGYGVGIYYAPYGYYEGIYILHVMENSPAEKAGLLDGDIILKINSKLVSDDYVESTNKFKGEKGDILKLSILRNGQNIDIDVTIKDYTIETVIKKTFTEDNQKIGYLRILSFDKITAKQFNDKMDELLAEGCESVVFDIRDNLGGEIDSVKEMLDKLLPEGPILQYIDKNGNIVETISSDKNEINCKMIVLVNENTASAAELFASALRDYNKAKLVGTQTYGKGCVLSGYYTSTGGVLYVTSMLYKTPNTDCFDKIGLTPDYIVEIDFDENLFKLKYEDDLQLQNAIEIIK